MIGERKLELFRFLLNHPVRGDTFEGRRSTTRRPAAHLISTSGDLNDRVGYDRDGYLIRTFKDLRIARDHPPII